MKKLLLTAMFLIMACGIASAADGTPALLLNTPLPAPVAGTAPADPVCAPPPPACPPPAQPVCPPPPPPPVCPPAPPACPPPAAPVCPPAPPVCDSGSSRAARQPAVAEYRVVPVKKKVYEDEVYTVNETRTETLTEIHTKVIKPKAPRLARVARDGDVALVVVKDKARIEPVTKKVKHTYTVPVTKTRRVAKEVEELTVVQERRWLRR